MILLPENTWNIKKLGKMGRGVFATSEIPAGTVIGDYIGKVIPGEQEYKYDRKGHFYLMYYHDNASIYPDVPSAGIHVLNHSCTPNVWMYTYKGHTLYFAIRKIFPGEELTVSYLLSPDVEDCKPCTHLCTCGSIICTGTMHLPEEKYDKWTTLNEKIEKKTKRGRIRYNKTLSLLDEYPESLPDAPLYTLFGNMNEKPQKLFDTKVPSVAKIRKVIRESGRTLLFPKLNLHIFGVTDGTIVSEPIR